MQPALRGVRPAMLDVHGGQAVLELQVHSGKLTVGAKRGLERLHVPEGRREIPFNATKDHPPD
jgi:hypothetical protein